MSKLYDRIYALCQQKGVNITEMCRSSGANRGSLTDLKNGRKKSLSIETLSKIAVYFDVPLEYLLADNESYLSSNCVHISDATVVHGNTRSVKIGDIISGSQGAGNDLTEQETELLRIFRRLSLRDKITLMATAFDLEDKSTK